MAHSNYFQVGGTLSSDNNSYVVRQADKELLNYLLQGNFCFVLNCRQMGKSSLMVKTADKLRDENISCAFSDLSVLGIADVSPEQWYKSFAYQLLESLDLDDIDLDSWWEKHSSLTAINCLEKFFDKVILTELSNKIVVFVDEIDSIIRLPFKDDFFALIRGFYNKRTINDKYKRLTFCLLGVATPPDLIEDKVRTPFNIGYPIELSGFTPQEAKNALIPGFPDYIQQPETIIKDVIKWTGGQPFLTQKLCLLIAQHSDNKTPNVEEIVSKYMVNDWESQDYPQHFKTISDRILHDPDYTIKLLELYRQILQQEIVADNSLAQNKLRISGLVNKKENYLKVYNPIYARIFNEEWIREQVNKIRPYSLQLNKWVAANFSDEHLLKENSLTEAIKWAENKNIAREDHQYLSASTAKQEKNKILARSKKILVATIVIAGTIITGTTLFASNKSYQKEISTLEAQSNAAVKEFDSGEQIVGLSKAIAVNSTLQSKIKNNESILSYPTVNPIVDLNNIINSIQEKNVLKVSNSAITRIVYTPDGLLVTGNEAGNVKTFDSDLQTVTDFKTLQNKGKITGIATGFDEREITVADRKQERVTVYNRNGTIKNFFNTNDVCSLAISPDGEFIVLGNDAGELTIRTKDGQKIVTKSVHKGTINSIAISPDGNLIATGSNDTTAKIWTIEGTLVATLSGDIGHHDAVNSVAFSPDGNLIVTGSNDTTIKLWDIDGSLHETLSGHNDAVNSVAFSPDGNLIATASNDTTIKLWNKKGELQTIAGHQSNVTSIAFNTDGDTFASADEKGIIKIWQTPSFSNPIQSGVFIEDRQQLLLNYPYPQRNEIKSIAGKTIEQFPAPKSKFINSIAISLDNNTIVAAIHDGIIAKLNLQNSNSWELWEQSKYRGQAIAVDFHPSEENLITLGTDETQNKIRYVVKQWNLDGDLIKTFNNDNEREITAIKYSPDGDIAIATAEGDLELWNNRWNDKNDSRTTIVDSHKSDNAQENITSIAFSSDKQLIATANKKGTIQLRKIDGTLLATFTKNNNTSIVHLDFTADGRTIKAIERYGNVDHWYLDIDTLIQKGCGWLKDYLVTHDEKTELSQICF